jgi:hypothetical protein
MVCLDDASAGLTDIAIVTFSAHPPSLMPFSIPILDPAFQLTIVPSAVLLTFGKTAAEWIVKERFGYTRNELALIVATTLARIAVTLAIAAAARKAGLFD